MSRPWNHIDSHINVVYIFQPFCEPASMTVTRSELAKIAQRARHFAYAPYSKFRVGAALLTTSGRVFTGCNVENSSYSLTICAERTAIFKAISEGYQQFKAMAVSSDDPGFTPPCGACRQVLIDLAGNIDFIMVNKRGQLKTVTMKSLVPLAFTKKNLQRSKRKK